MSRGVESSRAHLTPQQPARRRLLRSTASRPTRATPRRTARRFRDLAATFTRRHQCSRRRGACLVEGRDAAIASRLHRARPTRRPRPHLSIRFPSPASASATAARRETVASVGDAQRRDVAVSAPAPSRTSARSREVGSPLRSPTHRAAACAHARFSGPEGEQPSKPFSRASSGSRQPPPPRIAISRVHRESSFCRTSPLARFTRLSVASLPLSACSFPPRSNAPSPELAPEPSHAIPLRLFRHGTPIASPGPRRGGCASAELDACDTPERGRGAIAHRARRHHWARPHRETSSAPSSAARSISAASRGQAPVGAARQQHPATHARVQRGSALRQCPKSTPGPRRASVHVLYGRGNRVIMHSRATQPTRERSAASVRDLWGRRALIALP